MTSISTGEYRKSARNVDLIVPKENSIIAKVIAESKGSYFKYMFEQIVEHTREESEKKELFLRGLESLSSIFEDISSNNEVIHDISALKNELSIAKIRLSESSWKRN